MANEILDHLYKERGNLLVEIQRTAPYQRLVILDQLIASYGGDANTSVIANPPKKQVLAPSSNGITKRDSIIKYASECISNNGGFAHRDKIKQYLDLMGIEVSDGALSAYLSGERDIFTASRTKGWGLKDSTQTNTGDAQTSPVVGVSSETNSHPPVQEKGTSHGLFQ